MSIFRKLRNIQGLIYGKSCFPVNNSISRMYPYLFVGYVTLALLYIYIGRVLAPWWHGGFWIFSVKHATFLRNYVSTLLNVVLTLLIIAWKCSYHLMFLDKCTLQSVCKTFLLTWIVISIALYLSQCWSNIRKVDFFIKTIKLLFSILIS